MRGHYVRFRYVTKISEINQKLPFCKIRKMEKFVIRRKSRKGRRRGEKKEEERGEEEEEEVDDDEEEDEEEEEEGEGEEGILLKLRSLYLKCQDKVTDSD